MFGQFCWFGDSGKARISRIIFFAGKRYTLSWGVDGESLTVRRNKRWTGSSAFGRYSRDVETAEAEGVSDN